MGPTEWSGESHQVDPGGVAGDTVLHREQHVEAGGRHRRMGGRGAGDAVLFHAAPAHPPDRQRHLPLPLRERVRRPRCIAQAQLECARGRFHGHRHRECRAIAELVIPPHTSVSVPHLFFSAFYLYLTLLKLTFSYDMIPPPPPANAFLIGCRAEQGYLGGS